MMVNLDSLVQQYYSADASAVQSWCNDLYTQKFGITFDEVRELHTRMSDKSRAITDTELSWILIDLPLKMFVLSEALNALRLELEVIKLNRKRIRRDIDVELRESPLPNSQIADAVSVRLIEHDVLVSAYNAVVTRVENEISFSRELIMGAKKIWDSRRKSEVAAVSEQELPPYSPPDRPKKAYIRGESSGCDM